MNRRINIGLIFRIFFCLGVFSTCLYSYLETQNELTSLRISIPDLASKLRGIEEENAQLHYQIEMRESPSRLMQIARQSEFAHMKYPSHNEVLTLKEGAPFPERTSKTTQELKSSNKLAFVK